MLEGELEEAICRQCRLLLPDMVKEGYRIEARQAVLLGRRLDLLLRGPDRRACIIELKRGLPDLPDVRDQVLDYAECWRASFPTELEPRLIVIGTRINDRVIAELSNFGIECRVITEQDALAVLESCEERAEVLVGLKLLPDDTARVRHLLSDYDAVTVPSALLLQAPWNHQKVFLALVKRGETHKDLWKKDIYVQIHPQCTKSGRNLNCAVLYGPKSNQYLPSPLHLNPRRNEVWRANLFERLKPAIRYVHTDNKGNESSNFDHYEVLDWDLLAQALDL